MNGRSVWAMRCPRDYDLGGFSICSPKSAKRISLSGDCQTLDFKFALCTSGSNVSALLVVTQMAWHLFSWSQSDSSWSEFKSSAWWTVTSLGQLKSAVSVWCSNASAIMLAPFTMGVNARQNITKQLHSLRSRDFRQKISAFFMLERF